LWRGLFFAEHEARGTLLHAAYGRQGDSGARPYTVNDFIGMMAIVGGNAMASMAAGRQASEMSGSQSYALLQVNALVCFRTCLLD